MNIWWRFTHCQNLTLAWVYFWQCSWSACCSVHAAASHLSSFCLFGEGKSSVKVSASRFWHWRTESSHNAAACIPTWGFRAEHYRFLACSLDSQLGTSWIKGPSYNLIQIFFFLRINHFSGTYPNTECRPGQLAWRSRHSTGSLQHSPANANSRRRRRRCYYTKQ